MGKGLKYNPINKMASSMTETKTPYDAIDMIVTDGCQDCATLNKATWSSNLSCRVYLLRDDGVSVINNTYTMASQSFGEANAKQYGDYLLVEGKIGLYKRLPIPYLYQKAKCNHL